MVKSNTYNSELRIYVDQQQREIIPLYGRSAWVIGSSEEADACLPFRGVSGKHCLIERTQDLRHVLRDLNSKNGTKVNGRQVHSRQELRPGDLIQLGYVTIVFLRATPESEDC